MISFIHTCTRLVFLEPLLIDKNYHAHVEDREIISNLSKAAGLAHMISTIRPDIDHADEYVRNNTAVLPSPSLLQLLVSHHSSPSHLSLREIIARHTDIRIVQQIAIMMGCAVLPYLRNLVDCIAHGLSDEQQKVRTMRSARLHWPRLLRPTVLNPLTTC